MKAKVFELKSENLTNLGGPMGSEYTTTNWRKLFETEEAAKKYAEKNYGRKIKWVKSGKHTRSPDLSYVMYHIKEVKVKS